MAHSSEAVAMIVEKALCSLDVSDIQNDPIFYRVETVDRTVYVSMIDGQEFTIDISEDTSHA